MNDNKQHILSQLQLLPRGWYVELIPNMVDELVSALGPYAKDFEIWQCKEKFGELRMYYGIKGTSCYDEDPELADKINTIVNKHVDMSAKICAGCGKPATHTTAPWILHVCDSCDDKTI